MSEKVKQKRERSKNYLEEEKETLISIVQRYLNVIENKRTDAVNSQEKMKTWNLIAAKYNSTAKTGERTGIQLKLLYEAMKKVAKKHKADDKVETYKTGSGAFTPVSTNTDFKIVAMLEPQLTPHLNLYDSNEPTSAEIAIDDTVESNEIIDYIVKEATEKSSAQVVSDDGSVSACKYSAIDTGSEKVSAPKTDIKKTFFHKLKKKQTVREKQENLYLNEILEMKRERHLKKMEILEIMKQNELLNLKLKEDELKSKGKI